MRIAVIGSGISGLGAAWLLDKTHEVTLYESASRFGGHTNTVSVSEAGREIAVDTGFIVFNDQNYPHLSALFRHLEVPVTDSDMSFAASIAKGRIEYAGDNLLTLFAQPANLLRPSHWRMLRDIVRFNRLALAWLDEQPDGSLSLDQFLADKGLGPELAERYLLPMAAAIWSAPMQEIRSFPALSFLRFFRNHGLLQVTGRPQWRTVVGGGREYVKRILDQLGQRAAVDAGVVSVKRSPRGVLVRDEHGHEAEYQQVIMACHADQSLAILEDANQDESDILSAFRFQANRAYLHSDSTLMPRRRGVWAAWNYLSAGTQKATQSVSVSYWMNRLQPLNSQRDYFVSLNPPEQPNPALTWYTTDYDHPVFDAGAIRAQDRLKEIQGRDGVWFCGAWTAYGFHEDGLRSAVNVVNAMGHRAPWQHSLPETRIASQPLPEVAEESSA